MEPLERKTRLDLFMDDYGSRFNEFLKGAENSSDTARAFASCFIEATPLGVTCGKNDSQFLEMIPKGYAFYKNIGIVSMVLAEKKIELLDEFHALVKAHWRADFRKKDNSTGSMEFDIIYLVQELNKAPKIFAYIAPDENKAMREYGLIG